MASTVHPTRFRRATRRAWYVLLLCGAVLGPLAVMSPLATAAAPPTPVRGVWVVSGDGRNTITWDLNGGTNTHSRIYRSTTDGALGTLLATVPLPSTSYVDATATNGTSYYYTVRGWDGSSESASPAAQVVRTGASYTTGRWWGDCSTVLNGKLWTFGGYTGGVTIIRPPINDAAIRSYDPVTNSTAVSAYTVPSTKYWCGAARSGGLAYLAGGGSGENGATTYNTIARFNPLAGLTTMNGTLPTTRYQVASETLANGEIVTVGGQAGSNEYKSIAKFDPVADPAGAIPSDEATLDYNAAYGVQVPQISSVDGSLFLIGGADTNGSNNALNLTKQLDVTWSPVAYLRTNRPALSSPRLGAASATLNDRVYVLGGATSCAGGFCTATRLIESYDTRSATWRTEATTLANRMYRPAGHRIKGYVYLAGGNGGVLLSRAGYYRDIYRFDPGGQARGTASAPLFATSPSGLGSVAALNSITLSWTGGTMVDTYRVFRSTVAGQLGTLIEENSGGVDAPATSIVDANVSNCVHYYTVTGVGYDGRETAATTPLTSTPSVSGPCDAAALRQYRSDATTSLPSGGATTDGVTSNVVFRFSVSHDAAGRTITPWVEVRTDPTLFSATCGQSIAGATFSGAPVVATTAGSLYGVRVDVTGLVAGNSYYWRACGIDDLTRTSRFVEFGGSPDFRIHSLTSDRFYLRSWLDSTELTNVANEQASTIVGGTEFVPSVQGGTFGFATGWYPLVPSTATDASLRLAGEPANTPRSNPAGAGWVVDESTGRTIKAGTLSVHVRSTHEDASGTATIQCRAWRVTAPAGTITASTFLGKAAVGDVFDGVESTRICTPYTFAVDTTLGADESIYVELWLNVTGAGSGATQFSVLTDGPETFIEMPKPGGVLPDVPTLVSPANAAGTGLAPTLVATYTHPSSFGGLVEYEVATTAGFGGTTIRTGQAQALASGDDGSWVVAPALPAGTYHWRARAVDDADYASAWSASWTFVAANVPYIMLDLDRSSVALASMQSGVDAFSTVTATVETSNASGYQLLVQGTAPGASATTCAIGCVPFADAPGTTLDPQLWTVGVGGFGGVTVREASGGRLPKWGPGNGTAETSTTLNEYVGVPAAWSIVLHDRNVPTTSDTIRATLRFNPASTTTAGTHTEQLAFTVIPNP